MVRAGDRPLEELDQGILEIGKRRRMTGSNAWEEERVNARRERERNCLMLCIHYSWLFHVVLRVKLCSYYAICIPSCPIHVLLSTLLFSSFRPLASCGVQLMALEGNWKVRGEWSPQIWQKYLFFWVTVGWLHSSLKMSHSCWAVFPIQLSSSHCSFTCPFKPWCNCYTLLVPQNYSHLCKLILNRILFNQQTWLYHQYPAVTVMDPGTIYFVVNGISEL